MVYAYFEIVRHIVEHEPQGEDRAEYGKALLKYLSAKLTARFGEGFNNIRQFYLVYSSCSVSKGAKLEFSKQCLENSDRKDKQCLTNL